jgi:hypothetical protein
VTWGRPPCRSPPTPTPHPPHHTLPRIFLYKIGVSSEFKLKKLDRERKRGIFIAREGDFKTLLFRTV